MEVHHRSPDPFHEAESAVVRDVGRGSEELARLCRGDLRAASERLAAGPAGRRAVIVTGFVIGDADPPAPETDGPLGAISLAEVLSEAGYAVLIVTDGVCGNAVSSAAALASRRVTVETVSDPGRTGPALGDNIDVVIFVERPGRAADGRYRSMRNIDLTSLTEPLDELLAVWPHALSIGVADGGNEVGIGKLSHEQVVTATSLPPGAVSRVATDLLLLGAVSNWAAWALCAGLALCRPELRRGALNALDADRIQQQLGALVAAGAVDGVSRAREPTIDGLDWAEHQSILQHLARLIGPVPALR